MAREKSNSRKIIEIIILTAVIVCITLVLVEIVTNVRKEFQDHARSLSDRNDRSEKVENRGQITPILRGIVALFTEESGEYVPIPPLSQ